MWTEKTVEIAEEILPYLIYLAQTRQVTTYGHLAEMTGRHHRNFNYPLGYIRDEICAKRGLPMLTALLVNQGTGLPGDAFLAEGRDHLTDEEYARAFARFRDEVFAYPHWDALLAELGLPLHPKSAEDLEAEGAIHLEVQARQERSEEEERGRQLLKRWAAEHPNSLYLPTDQPSAWDYHFATGETCDLVFELPGMGTALVQVCHGRRGELVAAIRHLVVCRELIQKERDLSDGQRVYARIIAWQIPDDIRALAAGQDVRCTEVRRETVEGAG